MDLGFATALDLYNLFGDLDRLLFVSFTIDKVVDIGRFLNSKPAVSLLGGLPEGYAFS